MSTAKKIQPAIDFKEVITSLSSTESQATLYIKNIIPSNISSVKNHVILLHGINDHSGNYDNFLGKVKSTMGSNTMLTIYDHVGHGRSSGTRSHISSFSNYCKDLIKVMEYCKHIKKSDTKNIIVAPCLGGLITIKTLLDHESDLPFKVDGVVFSNPLLRPNFPMPRWSRYYVNRLNDHLMKLRVPMLFSSSHFFQEYEKRSRFEQDILNQKFYTISMMNEIVKSSHYIRSLSFYFDVPSLFLVSKDNNITCTDSIKTFVDGMSSSVELNLFPYSKHNILNDIEMNLAFDKVISWIKKL